MTHPRPTSPRIVHVNDVAGVASAAVAEARSQGLPWRLWELPAVRGRFLPVKIWRRAVDLARFHRVGRGADLLHIHYGHFAYYAWFVRRPYVLHLHGTDVRANLSRPLLGAATRWAIRRAGEVVYSTPDLRDAVLALRADATWLPAPLSPSVTDRPEIAWAPPAGAPRIVFASRWDAVKGLTRLLRLARELRAELPSAQLLGIDWGSGAAEAAKSGVELHPLMPESDFRDLLAGADIVIGQVESGALGVADLTAMALGRPVVARFTEHQAYGDEAPLWNTADIDPLAAVVAILSADSEAVAARCADGRVWALRHHGPARFVASALAIYRRIAAG